MQVASRIATEGQSVAEIASALDADRAILYRARPVSPRRSAGRQPDEILIRHPRLAAEISGQFGQKLFSLGSRGR